MLIKPQLIDKNMSKYAINGNVNKRLPPTGQPSILNDLKLIVTRIVGATSEA